MGKSTKFTIVWIPIEMTGLCLQKLTEQR